MQEFYYSDKKRKKVKKEKVKRKKLKRGIKSKKGKKLKRGIRIPRLSFFLFTFFFFTLFIESLICAFSFFSLLIGVTEFLGLVLLPGQLAAPTLQEL
jgi:hypothetical protein